MSGLNFIKCGSTFVNLKYVKEIIKDVDNGQILIANTQSSGGSSNLDYWMKCPPSDFYLITSSGLDQHLRNRTLDRYLSNST